MILNTFLVSVSPLLKDVSDTKATVIVFVVLMFCVKTRLAAGVLLCSIYLRDQEFLIPGLLK